MGPGTAFYCLPQEPWVLRTTGPKEGRACGCFFRRGGSWAMRRHRVCGDKGIRFFQRGQRGEVAIIPSHSGHLRFSDAFV